METTTNQIPTAELTKDKTQLVKNEATNPLPADEASSNKREMAPLKKARELFSYNNMKLSEQMQGLKVIIGVTISSSLIVTIALIVSIYQGDPEVLPHGGCSTATPHCSAICIDMLKNGGNAVDAAIASMFCIGVVNPHHSGIGGGGFMIVHNHKTMESTAFDFRETAPSSANPKVYENDPNLAIKGPFSVAVPGELKGMAEAHKVFGRLSWFDLVMPAVKLARNGFTASDSFVKNMNMHIKLQEQSEQFLAAFSKNGKIPAVGETMYRHDLADALETIANQGAKAFYDGPLSQEIVNATQGLISLEDLREYKVIKRDTVNTTYDNYAVLSVAPPSGGVILLSILNILNGYHFGPADRDSAQTYFKLIEAYKYAYAQRGSLGDPSDEEFREKIMNSTNYFLSPEAAKSIREKIDLMNNTSDYNISRYMPDSVFREDKGTAHVSVIDNDELMVSATTTINTWFGSGLLTKSGILLNNEMDDFSTSKHLNFFGIPPSQVNDIKPGKRPQSSVAPAIVHSLRAPCDMRLTIGGTNGSKIPTGIAEVLINILSFKMDLETASSVPRLHNQLFSNMTEYEKNFNKTIVKALSKMGQNMVKQKNPINIVQFVAKNYTEIKAISDHRKGNYSKVY